MLRSNGGLLGKKKKRQKTTSRKSSTFTGTAQRVNGRNSMIPVLGWTLGSKFGITSPLYLLTVGFLSYTYEVCLFGEAKQIPKKGGTTFSLGFAVLYCICSNFTRLKIPSMTGNSLLGTTPPMSNLEMKNTTKSKSTSGVLDAGMAQTEI